MKVLIIAHDVGSKEMGMLFRPYNIAQGLKARGHQVEVLTASYSRVRTKNPEINHDLQVTEVEGLPYHWIKSLKFSGNTLQRALGMFLFSWKIWCHANYFAKKLNPDAVIASSPHPLIIWGAYRIAKKSKARLYFEVRDIWPLSMHELSGMNKSHPFYVLCQWAEDFAYNKSNKVISLLPYAYEHMSTRGLEEKKFVCIPNGYDSKEVEEKIPLSESMSHRIEEFKKSYPFIVGYAGAHSLANSLGACVEACIQLEDKKIGLILVGDGSEKEALKQKAQGHKNILFLDPVSKGQALTVIDSFDLAYIGLKKSPLFKYGISPNKLIDYMALEKPVLYAIDTDRDPVQESNCGLRVPSDSVPSIVAAIEKISSLSLAERKSMGARGLKWVQENISYPILLDKYEQTLRT